MTGRRWNASILVAAVLAVVSIGCGVGGQTSPPRGSEREHRQAREALTRWSAAVATAGGEQAFVPVGDLTGQIGDWELVVGDNNKPALMDGVVEAAVPLSAATPPDADVRWDNGTTRSMPTISAKQALANLTAGAQPCPECVPLRVIGAQLSTARIETSRGSATAPAWEFTLAGTAVRVTRIAIAADAGTTVTPPTWDPNDPPVGLSIESATGTINGRELTVTFTGAPDPGTQPCGADYAAEAVESSSAVVVIVIEHPHALFEACTLVGARRTASVDLAAPLGQRAVLEVKQGLPVPVDLLP